MSLSFSEWVAYVFDHTVTSPEWYFEPGRDYWQEEPHAAVEFMTRLFEDPLRYAADYSDAQLNQGFWFLVSNGCSNHMFALMDAGVPWDARRRCIRSMTPLFEKLFAQRCTRHLSHFHEPEPGVSPLNLTCYMWWDLAPICGHPDDRSQADFDLECLKVMRSTLAIPRDACRESALHGLGHWQTAYPDPVIETIDRFLTQTPALREDLRLYAQAARKGCIL